MSASPNGARPASRPQSIKSTHSTRSHRSRTTEETPLLSRDSHDHVDEETSDTETQHRSQASTNLLQYLRRPKTFSPAKQRWPSIIALLVLFVLLILVLVLGFFAPAAVEEYASQAVDFKPTKLSLVKLTDNGVKVHVEGDLVIDASRVKKKAVRDFGRFGTWIAKEVETSPADVEVYMPEYSNRLAGTTKIPPIKVNVRNGHMNRVDFFSIIEPGPLEGLRDVANDWFDGRLGELVLLGRAEVSLKSGIFHLGTQTIQQQLKVEGSNLPSVPKYDIANLDVHEMNNTNGKGGMSADATIRVSNEFPLSLNVPAVGFDVMVDGCTPIDPLITVGNASTHSLQVEPQKNVNITASGDVRKLPHALTEACPNSEDSPLDVFLGNYIHGAEGRIYINCCTFPDPHTPSWANKLLDNIVVPLPFAGKTFNHLLKNFTLADVHFHLPEFWAEPGTPESQPAISANIIALVGLPEEMNFRLDVGHVRADALIFYKKKKLGRLDLHKWQQANSTRVNGAKDGPELKIISQVDKAPLDILDEEAFTEVVQTLLFGGKTLYLDVQATVDVQVDTPVGDLTIQKLPAQGVVPVKPARSHDGVNGLRPRVDNLEIVDTTDESVTIQASVNFTNPTKYSATVPYFSINILSNDTILGHAVVRDAVLGPGNNTNVIVQAFWKPGSAGRRGHEVGRELLSQYLSGYNTTLTFQTSRDSIPAQPIIGEILSLFKVTLPTPHLRPTPPKDGPDPPEDDSEAGPHFIKSTTMHVFSSSATFELLSPFRKTTLYLTWLNASAFYHEHPVGHILYDEPIKVPPGMTTTPLLPVDWSLGSVGFEVLKKALGRSLKLNATADVGVKIGAWEPQGGLWFEGHGIGAGIRP